MFSFTAVSALTLAALSLVNASPAVLKRSSHHCTPNFEGAPVSITFGDAELRIDANHNVVIDQLWVQKAEFRIENNGQANPGFIIKPVQNNNVALAFVDNTIKLQHVNTNTVDPAQTFVISCAKCLEGASGISGLVASDCSITALSSHRKCVQAPGSSQGPVHSGHCSASSKFQKFNFFTETQTSPVGGGDQESEHEWEEDESDSDF